jgi:hypothetical protein
VFLTVFILFVEKIVYDIRVKSDFILREEIFEKFMGFFKYPISHGFEVTFTTLLIKLKPQYLKLKSVHTIFCTVTFKYCDNK